MNDDNLTGIETNSGTIGSPKNKIFIMDDSFIIGEDIIEFNDIENICKSDYEPNDLNALGIYITNCIVVLYTIWVLSLSIMSSILLLSFAALFAYVVIQKGRTDIESFVSIKTNKMEYLIGVVYKEDVERLLNIDFDES